MLLTLAQIKPKSSELRRNSFFTRGGCVSCLRACFGARLLLQSEGADRVGGQLRGDKECPFSGVTKSGRVWRKVPESGALSVISTHPSEGADCVAGQLRGDKECPSRGVTKSGRVWRKVPESDARSVVPTDT